ncbi:DUF262 domain-containing protein [Pedobacter borealis]|uniref:DUF262 domain-containing protein n=1 Tax=Pedobacter borealis TaxID=475254 RepID=UPI00055F6489|nr:DUF262 domain-containing protein [Pedobacter borealis]
MAYEKPITVKEAIHSIQNQDFILPSIQREFVWTTDQIEILFDSILRDYPISTFLFWKVRSENQSKFKFYRFLPLYHERDKRHNDLAELSGDKDRMAILDGQQRLTSLYIGLCGSYSKKLSNYRRSSDHAFPEKQLYINLLGNAEGNEKEYEFKFLSKTDIGYLEERNPNKFHWFQVGKILKFNDLTDILNYLTEQSLTDTSLRSIEQVKFASSTLPALYQSFNTKELINFYLEKSEELDKVLHIFIRVNSGGTKLSYSDLLLSIATAQWHKRDARDVIHKFVDQINSIGTGFNISKDLVLKACLVLTDIKDIKFKVDNFSSSNMAKIESDWDDIAKAINLTIQLISHFGFSEKTLTANNAIIPIAYFLKKNSIGEEILHSTSQTENRKLIKEWLIRSLLKRVFGGTPDNLYPVYRSIISDNIGIFPLLQLIQYYKRSNKSLSFDEETINHLMNTQYGSAFAFMLLSLIYSLNHNYTFHQDHIHPKKYFTEKKLSENGIDNPIIRVKFLDGFNRIGNLQLIQETENLEKNATPFKNWVEAKYTNADELNNYKNIHAIPIDNDLKLNSFDSFYEDRKGSIKDKLMKILNVSKDTAEIQIVEQDLVELEEL